MLSGLAICSGLTAVVAGIAGAWSPCGFSMVETIGSAMGNPKRPATWIASTTFTLGAILGGLVSFGGLAMVGKLLDPGASGVREALGAILALAAAIADWRGVRIAPQIRRQVPERWRWTQPLPLACGLYGILLGLGFTTFVLAFAVWALAGISLATGDPAVGTLIGVGFGVGRAVPVLLMAPSFRGAGGGAQRLDAMAVEPRLWLGLRRLDAVGLGLCFVLLGSASASAATIPAAFDPTVASGALAWQQLTGPAVLRLPTGHTLSLPGEEPALGEGLIAWESAGTITVASPVSLVPVATVPAAGVNALAVSGAWVVFRGGAPGGGELLRGVSLGANRQVRHLAGAKIAGELGRPTLSGSSVVFSIDTPRRSVLELVDLASGARRTIRSLTRGGVLSNPSLLGRRLLYERSDRCAQKLLLGSTLGSASTRVLLRLPSTATRDPGYEQGFTHAYNSASLCRGRRTGRGSKVELGPTALSPNLAYVTELEPARDHARILAVSSH